MRDERRIGSAEGSGTMFVETLQAYSSILLLLLPLALLLLLRSIGSSKKRRLPPSPPRLPIVGNLHQLSTLPHRSLYDLAKKYGPIMFLKLGRMPTLVVSSADMAREIMKTHDLVFANRPSVKASRELLGNNMAFAPNGEYWRHLRKICADHLLSPKMVQSFRLVREEAVASMIINISRASSSPGPVNMRDTLKFFMSDLVTRVVLGEPSREEGRIKMFSELIGVNSGLFGAFCVEDYFPWLAWMDAFTGLDAKMKMTFKKWKILLDEIIKEHADRLQDDGGQDDNFVAALLSLQKDGTKEVALTHEAIRALLVDLLAAGTDTTYLSIEWGLAELVRNPEVMNKLQVEVRGKAQGKAMVKEEDLTEMSYLKAVLKEILRLHPAAPLLLPRFSFEKCEIQGYEIPKHTRVLINSWAISRDPELWDAPEEFRPERFMGSALDFRGQSFQFLPFGAGRRICPGMHFAIATMEIAFANLVHRFDWTLPDGVTPENMDMAEAPARITTCKRESLYLLAKPCLV